MTTAASHPWPEVKALFARDETEPEHPIHVAFLADQLFQSLAPLHHAGKKARLRLTAAALLHDIGWTYSDKGHHKKSRDLILAHPWHRERSEEAKVVAAIARYHRKALPALHHSEWAALDSPTRQESAWLAAILRIADALDASHQRLISQIQADLSSPTEIRLLASTSSTAPEEQESFDIKANLLALCANRRPSLFLQKTPQKPI